MVVPRVRGRECHCSAAVVPRMRLHVSLFSSVRNNDDELAYDSNSRRSSLGADSVLDQDFSEDGPLDSSVTTLSSLETVLGIQYADDIFAINKAMESRYHMSRCMADQPQVTENMRCTLVHWLIKVNNQLKFGPETVFVAVNLVDRFLAVTPLAQDCFQLLVVATLFIAGKMEESVVPGISELVSICGGVYRHHHFRRMEVLILSKLEFALYGPTSWYFLDHLAMKAAQTGMMDRRVVSVSRYVMETCLSSYEVSQFLPSVQAAAALSWLWVLSPTHPPHAPYTPCCVSCTRPRSGGKLQCVLLS
nr:cyclin-O-like [Cherax quadricarinatus]